MRMPSGAGESVGGRADRRRRAGAGRAPRSLHAHRRAAHAPHARDDGLVGRVFQPVVERRKGRRRRSAARAHGAAGGRPTTGSSAAASRAGSSRRRRGRPRPRCRPRRCCRRRRSTRPSGAQPGPRYVWPLWFSKPTRVRWAGSHGQRTTTLPMWRRVAGDGAGRRSTPMPGSSWPSTGGVAAAEELVAAADRQHHGARLDGLAHAPGPSASTKSAATTACSRSCPPPKKIRS